MLLSRILVDASFNPSSQSNSTLPYLTTRWKGSIHDGNQASPN